MKNRWLSFLIIAFLAVITFIFFFIRTSPIKLPDFSDVSEKGSLTTPTVTFINPSKGPDTAKVTIIEFGDFQCQSCRELLEPLKTVQQAYPNDVRLIWKNFPNESLHPQATSAAIAAHCADSQGAFWPYHDLLFIRQSLLSDDVYTQIAQELDLDVNRFTSCASSLDTLPLVQKDFEEARALGLSATPTLYINDELVVGTIGLDELLDLITKHLTDSK
jgi:protein-disulfide isomerase